MPNVGFLSVVAPGRIGGHEAFRTRMATEHITVQIRRPRLNGYYDESDLFTKAVALTAMDPCAIVAADTVSAQALIRARSSDHQPPLVISVPSNPTLEEAIASAIGGSANIYVAGASVPEPMALAWFLHEALRSTFEIGSNEIVVIGNDHNPGSTAELRKTRDWFDAHYGPASPKRISIVPKPVSRFAVPSPRPADATGLYNVDAVLNDITRMRTVERRNIKGLIGLGDPTAHFYRDAIKDYLAGWAVPSAWESWYGLTNGGFICWSGDRTQAWDRLINKVVELCAGGDDPDLEPIDHALIGNAAVARDLGLDWQGTQSYLDVPVRWYEDVPRLQPPDLVYSNALPKEPQPL